MPFMDSKNAAYNNVFNINVQDFCGSMTVLSFFVLLMLIKRGGWKLKAIRCCCTVVVMPSSFFYHPPSGQCSGNEVQRVSQVILHSGGVYVCVYMCIYISIRISTRLCHSVFIDKNPSHASFCLPLFGSCCGF